MTSTASKAIPDSGALGPPEPSLEEAVALLRRWRRMYPIGTMAAEDTEEFLERVDIAAWAEKELNRG